MKTIKLKSIFPNLNPNEYKIHFAKKASDGIEPLDDYKIGIEEWKEWNTYSNGKNWFNRDYVFSLINFFPKKIHGCLAVCGSLYQRIGEKLILMKLDR